MEVKAGLRAETWEHGMEGERVTDISDTLCVGGSTPSTGSLLCKDPGTSHLAIVMAKIYYG